METGELGTKSPPEPAVRPNADETEQALWELAHDELGGVNERLVTLQTQLQTATRRAESAERALDEARREKADVLTYTGNELRTPLEGILGMTELLKGTDLSGEQRDMLDSLTHNAQLLYSLLRGIIETASLGSEAASQDAVDLFDVIRSVIDELSGLAETREVVLLRSIKSGVPRMVEGDGERVRVLLRNLLESALRFLEKGEMELVVSMEGALPSGPMLRFTIHDTGAGLPPELLALLDGTPLPPGFEEATGLGGTARVLSASQEMAVGMDGSIQAETVTGQGAQLFLIMPFRWARRDAKDGGLQVAPGEDDSLKAATGRVLLVEDNPIARKVTASMLEQLGRAPELAVSGEQAVHLVQRNHYGLVLLDTDLPDMGWSEVTRLIRAAEIQAGRRSVLLGLVPHNGPALELCVAEGMDGILDKPVELKYLQDTLERFLGSDFMRVRVRDEPPTTSDATRFDPGFLAKQFPSDHRAAYEVLEVFLMDADQLETKLVNSVRTGNWPEVQEIGHSLKGVARNVGAARLASLAEDMESKAALGDIQAAGGVAGDVKAELAWLRGELAA
jgi:signal transduction histidine kinase/CheY-like chemotaxis protein/HPt (histidine-containing phosphotransfer) domain-containing protein